DAVEVGAAQVGAVQAGFNQARVGQVGVSQIGPGEIGAGQVGLAQAQTAQFSSGQILTAEGDVRPVAPDDVQRPQPAVEELGAGQFAVGQRGVEERALAEGRVQDRDTSKRPRVEPHPTEGAVTEDAAGETRLRPVDLVKGAVLVPDVLYLLQRPILAGEG